MLEFWQTRQNQGQLRPVILDAFNGDYIGTMTVSIYRKRDLLTPDGTLVANTFSSSNLYHHESNSYRQVFGDFTNYRRQDTGNRVILITQRNSDIRTPLSEELSAIAHAPFGGLRLRCADCAHAADVAIAAGAADWICARPLSDQYSPANLLQALTILGCVIQYSSFSRHLQLARGMSR